MAATTFKPTINIKSSFTTIGAGFTKANKSIGSMRTILLKKTKVKRDAIAGRKSLFGKRIENQRRKDEEAVVEASKPSAIGRIGNSVLNSGKGLFDRIVDFAGTLLVGWLVNNLPTIMTMAQDLMGRIQKTVNILGNFMRDIGAIFTGSTKVLGAVFTNITSLDFFDSNKKLSTALGELESVFDDMNKQFDDGLKTLTTPLGQMPGEAPVPPTGTDYTMPPGEEVNTKTLGSATDLKSGARAIMNAGFPAKGAAYLAGNIQQESGWRGQRSPWVLDDGAGTNKGLVSWNRGRITNAEKFLGKPLNKASNAEQIRWIKHEMKTYYPGAYKIFMSPNASDADLQKASYIYLGYGDVGSRFAYANRAYADLQKGGSTSQPAQVSSAPSKTSAPQTSTGGKVIQYITGDRTSPRYAADHAAKNYHDHIAFDSQATRDAAMKFLVGKGWTIGSVESGKHARGSYHYSRQAFDIPFYPNQSRKGVPDNAKGETALSSRLRADLIAGGFSGPQLGGGRSSVASVASVPSAAPSLPSTARAPQVMVMDDRPTPQPQQPQVASGGGSSLPMIDSENVLNNLMRNYLLLDLAYT
jgi:hypothetical protein